MVLGSSRRELDLYRRQRKAFARRTPTGQAAAAGQSEFHSPAELFRGLFELLKGQRLAVVCALGLLTLSAGLALVPAAATKIIVDYVLTDRALPDSLPAWVPVPEGKEQLLFWLAGLVISVSLVEVSVRLSSRWCITKAETCAQAAVRRKVFEHTLRLPLHKIHQLKSGGAASVLRDDAGRIADLIRTLVYNPWRAVIQLIGSLAILFYIDWRLVLGAAVLSPLVYLNHRSWHRRIRPIYRDISQRRQAMDSQVTEIFGGMRVVRAFGRARREASRFVRANNLIARLHLYAFRARSQESMWEVVTVLGSVGMLVYGGTRVIHGDLSLGDLMMFLSYLVMLLSPLEMLANTSNEFQGYLACFERVLDVLAEPQEMVARPGAVHLERGSVRGGITLADVSFHYPGCSQAALCGVDLEVRPGETLALVGRSGAGKTTLCNLVARFYDPTAGRIELDGRDLADIHVDSYRRLLGIVEQDVFLFDGTVAENIGYALPRAGMLEIERAARAAHVHEFVRRLEHGYNTVIGERGVRLSGGQRQRLAIARALLVDPRILILDEATSNLDSESEQFVRQSLERLREGRTCFVIAHRLSTILHADRIAVLEGGQIIEIGSHDELMALDGRYRQMLEAQGIERPLLSRAG